MNFSSTSVGMFCRIFLFILLMPGVVFKFGDSFISSVVIFLVSGLSCSSLVRSAC